MKNDWLDNYSWQPTAKEAPQADEQPSEPQPGSQEYLEMGCDHLYVTLGGEG